MFGALKSLMGKDKPTSKPADPATEANAAVPGLSRDANGHLKPAAQKDTQAMTASKNGNGDKSENGAPGGAGPAKGCDSGGQNNPQPAPAASTAPVTSALNQQVVQAAEFSNYENAEYAQTMVSTAPELMVGQTTGLAVQDAANYMNAIMQIAVAAQAVAIKKAAENPPLAGEEIPLLTDIQQMVTQAVGVYGSVSTAAGTSSKTVISDFKTGS
jgi:hypothetical protein